MVIYNVVVRVVPDEVTIIKQTHKMPRNMLKIFVKLLFSIFLYFFVEMTSGLGLLLAPSKTEKIKWWSDIPKSVEPDV